MAIYGRFSDGWFSSRCFLEERLKSENSSINTDGQPDVETTAQQDRGFRVHSLFLGTFAWLTGKAIYVSRIQQTQLGILEDQQKLVLFINRLLSKLQSRASACALACARPFPIKI